MYSAPMTTPWEAGEARTEDDAALARRARPGPLLGIIGFCVAAAGLAGAAVWPQLWVFGFRPDGIFQYLMPPLLSLCGLFAVPMGAWTAMGRLWAAIGGALAMAGLLFFGGIWSIYVLVNGGFTPLYFLVVSGALVGLTASLAGCWLSFQVSQARRALLED